MKNFFKSKTIRGLLFTTAVTFIPPEWLPWANPVLTQVAQALGLAYSGYGRSVATKPLTLGRSK